MQALFGPEGPQTKPFCAQSCVSTQTLQPPWAEQVRRLFVEQAVAPGVLQPCPAAVPAAGQTQLAPLPPAWQTLGALQAEGFTTLQPLPSVPHWPTVLAST